jgi:hypothetical protein
MAHDQSSRAHASGKTGRRRRGEDGHPQTPPTPEQQDAANRTKMTVTKEPEPNPQETQQPSGGK